MRIPARNRQAEINAIKEAIYVVAHARRPMTVRQISYQLVSTGEIEKTEGEYKQTIRSVRLGGRRSSNFSKNPRAGYSDAKVA